jgi:hypothetical protein
VLCLRWARPFRPMSSLAPQIPSLSCAIVSGWGRGGGYKDVYKSHHHHHHHRPTDIRLSSAPVSSLSLCIYIDTHSQGRFATVPARLWAVANPLFPLVDRRRCHERDGGVQLISPTISYYVQASCSSNNPHGRKVSTF